MIKQVIIISKDHRSDKFGDSTEPNQPGFTEGSPQSCWSKALKSLGREVKEITFKDLEFRQKGSPPSFFKRAYRKLRREFNSRRERMRIKNIVDKLILNKETLILIVGNFTPFNPKYLSQLKEKSACKVVLFHGLSTKWIPSRWIDEYSRIADLTVVNSKANADEFRAVGAKRVIALPYTAASKTLHIDNTLKKSDEEYEYEIGFVGSLYKELYENRLELLQEISDYNLAIWSYEGKYLLNEYNLGRFYQGETTRTGCPNAYRKCKIMLNIQGIHMPDGGNLSTFEIPGSGAFQIADACRDEWFEEGEEIITYSSVDDLRAKLNYFLNNDKERERIKRKGFEKVRNEHTYEDRFKKLFELIK